ncbi:ribonuclease 3 isoform X2 [Folsomia candida]|uniref:ribonuclease 3 isoform X2 n=1 Tax=Folsomia candida TaxID=158441 RepID=UPI000B8FA916|nr:ribonuclease 3 isoform X2 [Folsomia candida]
MNRRRDDYADRQSEKVRGRDRDGHSRDCQDRGVSRSRFVDRQSRSRADTRITSSNSRRRDSWDRDRDRDRDSRFGNKQHSRHESRSSSGRRYPQSGRDNRSSATSSRNKSMSSSGAGRTGHNILKRSPRRDSHRKNERISDKSQDDRNYGSDASSDQDLDDLKVEKWTRSAPDEMYYTRVENGDFCATDATKTLCDTFEKRLLLKAETARLEAEKLGFIKFEELNEEIELKAKKQKKEAHLGEACSKTCSKGNSKPKNLEDLSKSATSKEDPQALVEDSSQSKPPLDQPVVCCTHEEGEICDCEETVQELKVNTEESKCDKNESKNSDNCAGESKKQDTKCHKKDSSSSSSSSSSDESSSSEDSSDEDEISSKSSAANSELEKRKLHPRRLHPELWHNDPGLMNDGPLCRCSAKARRCGIRHGYFPGESIIPPCIPFSTNRNTLHHYRITICPAKNFLVKTPSVIRHDGHEYIFEGFSLLSHYKIDLKLPPCRVIRFNIRYDVFVTEEKFPESFCVRELELFETYVFREILELLDLKYDWGEQGSCAPFHLMPRFVRQLPDNGKEILSMNRVMLYLLKSDRNIFKEKELPDHFSKSQTEWQNFADKHKGMIVSKFGQKPCSLRVDQIDRDTSGHESEVEDEKKYPLLVHFGIRPPQLSYAGDVSYQRAWRRYVKYRHLLSNMAKPSAEEKRILVNKELKLQKMRTASTMKRDVTIAISAKGFRTTGIFCDLVQHAMLIPVLVAHLRFHKALSTLETRMRYEFTNRYLLQLAMTHPSYRENFGTNPDHARNSLTNCGIRQPEYGDRRIHYTSTRKRGITTLINIMAKFGSDQEMESEITHNERLEFLGDAVVEFVTSIHLFHLFPGLEEGGLATYRAAIVQNQHLAVLAKVLSLDQYMLYAHGSDLCHDSELRHAMANCFEALMGALFLDGGIQVSDRVFAKTFFSEDDILHQRWANYPRHPLQQEEPDGDREWIEHHQALQKLTKFEDSIGVEFTHIRLLARAFTDRSLGYNNLSQGSNQRLEFLGDTVLQLISSDYLYRHFPDHHEGHLSLLRSALVNNRTQAYVCDDLGMTQYAMRDPKSEMKTKDRADLLEAVLGALYIDKGLLYCTTFCSICFFPRLNESITKQEWNDPKSKLQQCCLTLRAMDGREPDIPVYKVTESLGPTNTRVYTVAVYFRGTRLATAKGHSIQEAEMNAAATALKESGHLFPQLHHQKSVVDKTSKFQRKR